MSTAPSRSQWITQSALFLALGIVLPYGFHLFGAAGRIFLPMHIPVLLAGFLVGPASGVIVGLLAPGLSHLLTGMPPGYAVPLMMLELSIYGLIAGLAYYRLHLNIYLALLIAMIFGRLMFALGLFVLTLIGFELPYGVAVYFSMGGPIITGLPGIVLQLVLVPVLVAAVRRSRAE